MNTYEKEAEEDKIVLILLLYMSTFYVMQKIQHFLSVEKKLKRMNIILFMIMKVIAIINYSFSVNGGKIVDELIVQTYFTL